MKRISLIAAAALSRITQADVAPFPYVPSPKPDSLLENPIVLAGAAAAVAAVAVVVFLLLRRIRKKKTDEKKQ